MSPVSAAGGPRPDQPFRARPYLLTGGRTRSAVDLPIEALVRTSAAGKEAYASLHNERRAIVERSVQPLSIAELSAYLDIHLQVAKVLVGDLVSEGLLETSNTSRSTSPGARPDVQLLEQVLNGLQTLGGRHG